MRRLPFLLAALSSGLLPACDEVDQEPKRPPITKIQAVEPSAPPRPDGQIRVMFLASSTALQGVFASRTLTVTLGGTTRSIALKPRQSSLSVEFTLSGPGEYEAYYTLTGLLGGADGIIRPCELPGRSQFLFVENDSILLDPFCEPSGEVKLQVGRMVPTDVEPPPESIVEGREKARRFCGACSGWGKETCTVCRGRGETTKWVRGWSREQPDTTLVFSCANCNGSRKVTCTSCGGSTYAR